MIKKLFTLLSIALFGVTAAQAQAPAFPGAEGHGRYVTGGRATDGTTILMMTVRALCVMHYHPPP